jgi:hypothetical protein
MDLRDERFNPKLQVSEENIYKFISDYDIFKYYFPEVTINGVNHSPLRKDNHPSFSVYTSRKYSNKILYHDLATGDKGDSIHFVKNLFHLNYREALEQIIVDFNLQDKFYIDTIRTRSSSKNPKVHKNIDYKKLEKHFSLNIKSREWRRRDVEYWKSYGVSLDTLKKYRVRPLLYIFINDDVIKADPLAYAYVENKNNVIRFKVYQPESKVLKWISGFLPNTLSGYEQLPEKGELLFIASSLKDGMCLHDLGYNFVAPQSENYEFKDSLIKEFKSRFNHIVTFYDFDDAGIKFSKKLEEKFNIPYINTGSMLKDISDYYYFNGKEESLKLIKEQLKEIGL